MNKKCLNFSLLAIFSLFFVLSSRSQVVIVNVYQPPYNQWNVADMWNLTLTNTSSESLKVYLYGTVESITDGLIFEGTSAVFGLTPHFSGRIEPYRLEPVDADYSNAEYEEIVMKTGTMPEGTYTICVYVKDARTNEELGSDCIIRPIKQPSPPELINPQDEGTLTEQLPIFLWTPPMPLRMGEFVTYQLNIVELLDGQVPIEAMEANPAWFTDKNIISTSYQFPISARPLEPGKSYAWQVTAINEKQNYEIGKSEVWSFTFKKEEVPPVIQCQELFCNPDNWEFGTPSISTKYSPTDTIQDNNTLYLTQPVQISPNKIVMLKASIIYFYWNASDECKQCNDRYHDCGNFTGGMATDPSFTSSGTAPTVQGEGLLINCHDLFWTPVTSSEPARFKGDLNLLISLPRQTENSSCSDDFNFCIRYTITFMDKGVARFCSVVQPYSYNRQHKGMTTSLQEDEENKLGNNQ